MMWLGAAVALFFVTAADPAAAHGGLAGKGGFVSGALHPFLAVEHLVLLLGLGLLSGRTPRERRGMGFAALGAGLVVGVTVAQVGQPLPARSVAVAILVLALATGGLVSLAPHRLSAVLVAGLAALAGLAVGLDTDIADAGQDSGLERLVPMAGLATGVYLIVLDAAALASLAARPVFLVAVRVAGSWIAAVGLMLLALALGPIRATG